MFDLLKVPQEEPQFLIGSTLSSVVMGVHVKCYPFGQACGECSYFRVHEDTKHSHQVWERFTVLQTSARNRYQGGIVELEHRLEWMRVQGIIDAWEQNTNNLTGSRFIRDTLG